MARTKADVKVPGDTQPEIPADVVVINAEPPANAPEAAEVNPDEIHRAVLTKDGWVVPTGKALPTNRF